MLSPSRRRLLKRLWIVFAFILFAAQCGLKLRPYLRSIAGARAPSSAPASPSAASSTARSRTAGRASLRLASWNLHFLDVEGRGHDARSRADQQALARYAAQLDADVIAVQEVASEAALRPIFPPEVYSYHLAARGGAQRTGFVFRSALGARVLPDLDALALKDLRSGSELSVRVAGRELRLLAVHLKAFCVSGALTQANKHCRKLRDQLPVLEGWIDARARERAAFAVLGDFNRALGEPDDPLFRELDDADPPGLELQRASLRTHSSCRPAHPQRAIDHMLLGGAATRWLAPPGLSELPFTAEDLAAQRKLSDHCPIQLTLSPSALP